jgi:hypothetical protein
MTAAMNAAAMMAVKSFGMTIPYFFAYWGLVAAAGIKVQAGPRGLAGREWPG